MLRRLSTVLPLCLAACGEAEPEELPPPPGDVMLSDWMQAAPEAWQAAQNARLAAWVGSGSAEDALAANARAREVLQTDDWIRRARDAARSSRFKESSPTTRAALQAIQRLARREAAATRQAEHEAVGLQARLRARTPLDDALAAWEPGDASAWYGLMAHAREQKPGFFALRDQRNANAEAGRWPDALAASLAPLDLQSTEALQRVRAIEATLTPLLRELHTWTRRQHGRQASDSAALPTQLNTVTLAHPLGFDWSLGPATTADAALRHHGPELTAEQVRLWAEVAFGPLRDAGAPSVTPVPRDGVTVWSTSLTEPQLRWTGTVLAGLPGYTDLARAHLTARAYGHAFDPALPGPLLAERPGALTASLALWGELAATRPETLARLGVEAVPQAPSEPAEAEVDASEPDPTEPAPTLLLAEALHWLPRLAGQLALAELEYALYVEGIPSDQLTTRWWELAQTHLGVVPPETRTERWADPLVWAPLTTQPGHSVESVFAITAAFQLHHAAAAKAGVDPRTADLAGHRDATEPILRKLARAEGLSTLDDAFTDATGRPLTADAMLDHFSPLLPWLRAENQGVVPTFGR